MKYELDTMPVWDALKRSGECIFCDLENASRQRNLKYFLGSSVMVPETRVEINEHGFSKENALLLNMNANRQGLGLIFSTRFKTILGQWTEKRNKLSKTAEKISKENLLEQVLDVKSGFKQELTNLKTWISNLQQSCLIKEKIEADLKRYAFTFVQLWKQDPDFRVAWKSSSGFCLNHFPLVLDFAEEFLSKTNFSHFFLEIAENMDKNLFRVFNDLMDFTKTFDSTGSHQITGKIEKAIERSLQKIYGVFPGYKEGDFQK